MEIRRGRRIRRCTGGGEEVDILLPSIAVQSKRPGVMVFSC